MTTCRRGGNKWTINELLSLQREYELLEWTVQQIAEKHERSIEAILYRLESEGFITSWNEARGCIIKEYKESIEGCDSLNDNCEDNENDENDDEDYDNISSVCDDTSIDNVQILSDRVSNLENIIFDVKDMMQKMMNEMKKNFSGSSSLSSQ